MATDSAFYNPFFYEDSWSEYEASYTRGDLGTDGGFECAREVRHRRSLKPRFVSSQERHVLTWRWHFLV